ncbi:hypothetical protein JQ581_02470 [Bradyrhizobium liaoningense]|uniref:hypothetical protein n=1 Tax=Bradyrhizobium liaoningense TaxID=43992 RepID=UPI001BA8CFC1|nr:hypothetical protein [Bradyrhizobium liaoningense]MBR0735779.1 hypothetical protein [Bradyrhizobium liaoningense]
MADPTQYTFDLQEVAEALVKKQGLTSGRWTLGVEFNFTAMMAGASSTEIKPSALVQVSRLQLIQVGPDTPPGAPIVEPTKSVSRKRSK